MPLVVHHDGHEPAFDHLHEDQEHLHDTGNGTDSSPLELSDGGSGPRTPPALGRTHAQLVSMLPADPRQAIWPYPSSAKNSTSNPQAALLPKKLKKQTLHSHTPTPASGAPPTISTFSASNLNHIHIVQPYVHAQQNDSGSASDDSTTNKASNKHPLNLCTTSTFSVHPTPAITSGQLSFANPYCTNALHTFMPANGAAGAGGPGGGGPSATGASGQPPRPANAWILYRSDKMKDIAPSLPGQPRPPQADISKLIAAMWKNETSEIRQHYEALSDMKKAEHLALYPGYRFQPMKKADREKVRAEKRAEKEREKMAAIALKNYARKPKAKRGATEDSVGDVTSPTIPQPMAALPWQVQVTGQAAASSPTATVTSPTSSRGHAFSYQPYAAPSAPSSAAAPVKRKRAKTKVEIETPAIPPEESQASALDSVYPFLFPLTLSNSNPSTLPMSLPSTTTPVQWSISPIITQLPTTTTTLHSTLLLPPVPIPTRYIPRHSTLSIPATISTSITIPMPVPSPLPSNPFLVNKKFSSSTISIFPTLGQASTLPCQTTLVWTCRVLGTAWYLKGLKGSVTLSIWTASAQRPVVLGYSMA